MPITLPFQVDAQGIIDLATPFLTPGVVWLIKNYYDRLPVWLTPIIAVLIGSAVNLVGQAATVNTTGQSGNIFKAVALGMAAIGVRELQNQISKRAKEGPKPPPLPPVTIPSVPFQPLPPVDPNPPRPNGVTPLAPEAANQSSQMGSADTLHGLLVFLALTFTLYTFAKVMVTASAVPAAGLVRAVRNNESYLTNEFVHRQKENATSIFSSFVTYRQIGTLE